MTGADFLITLPEFPDKKVSIKDFGAVENQTDIAGSKRNAAAINSAMSVISNEGGGTVVIPKGSGLPDRSVCKAMCVCI